jgi:uncharacterized protein involved in outer membrane biogenesis
MKKFLMFLLGLVLLAAVAAVLVPGPLIKAVVQKAGSRATGTEVTLDAAKLGLLTGSARLSGLRVANPDGFDTDSAFDLASLSLRVRLPTVLEDTVVIEEVVIDGPVITYEQGRTGSNLDAIRKHAAGQADDRNGRDEEGDEGGDTGPGKKVIIEHLYLRDGEVHAAATGIEGRTVTAELPEIHLQDLGKDRGGLDADALVAVVLEAVGERVAKAAQEEGVGRAVDDVRERLDQEGGVGGAVEGLLHR